MALKPPLYELQASLLLHTEAPEYRSPAQNLVIKSLHDQIYANRFKTDSNGDNVIIKSNVKLDKDDVDRTIKWFESQLIFCTDSAKDGFLECTFKNKS